MSTVADFFSQHIITVYFIYGLSFFSMGLAVAIEAGHSSELDFARALKPLAAFGLLHGTHEWLEMFLLIHAHIYNEPTYTWIAPLRLILLAASFMMLVVFGARLIAGVDQHKKQYTMVLIILAVWVIGLVWVLSTQPPGLERTIAADVYTRYSLAIPGAVLAAWGLILQRRKFIKLGMYGFGRDVSIAAVAFALYGCVGQLFASRSPIFLSEYLNQDMFVLTFGFPVQVFRAAMACIVAVFIIRSLRVFEVENRRHIEELQEAQFVERRRLEDTRSEMLHRTVLAQESERQRIARELHDETGQTLTALGLGLRGLSETIKTKPSRAVQQAHQLESLAISGLEELERQVSGLRPPQLDDLGLLAALRWSANEASQHYGVPIEVIGNGDSLDLPSDVRVSLFRISQEAVNNAVRHAEPGKITVKLDIKESEIDLMVEDDGSGFDVESSLNQAAIGRCWGILGMIERAALVGGTCEIHSQSGEGTVVQVNVPLEGGGACG